jgi:hypothetical protein
VCPWMRKKIAGMCFFSLLNFCRLLLPETAHGTSGKGPYSRENGTVITPEHALRHAPWPLGLSSWLLSAHTFSWNLWPTWAAKSLSPWVPGSSDAVRFYQTDGK